MKNLKTIVIAFLCSLVIMTSCRTEDDAMIDPPEETALTTNSTIANLLNRTSQNDGSFDNIIDNASCFSIQLPVTVIVNGIEIIVTSQDDYQAIENIFDADVNDIDTLDIVFPITVVFADYSTSLVNSYPQLFALIAQCPEENADDDDIECIDFQYPITASVFNINNEVIETIVITNDNEMYNFIEDLDDYAAVTINFPITVIYTDGTTMVINSIAELQNAIEAADNTCDEDDDNDYDDDDCTDCTSNELEAVFAACMEFEVDKLERNNNDLEDRYEGYVFSFEDDGTITVTENGNTILGSWLANCAGNNITVVINIPELPDFNDTWNVNEIEQESDEAKVDLRKNGDRLRFKSDCSTGNTGGDLLSDTLTATNSVWLVGTYLDDGTNETSDFNGFEFTFNTSGVVSAINGNNTVTGSWSSQNNATKLDLDFGSNAPLEELNDDWDVISISPNRVELRDVSGGGGGTDTLIFIRQ